jgi:hypothetical protein
MRYISEEKEWQINTYPRSKNNISAQRELVHTHNMVLVDTYLINLNMAVEGAIVSIPIHDRWWYFVLWSLTRLPLPCIRVIDLVLSRQIVRRTGAT